MKLKSVLRMMGLEIKLMFGSLLTIGVILVLFTAALISVLTVRIEIPDCMYGKMGKEATYLFYSVEGTTLKDAQSLGGEFVLGAKSGLTYDVTVKSASGKTLGFDLPADQLKSFLNGAAQGCAASAGTDLSQYSKALKSGSLPENEGEALIADSVASTLGVKVGDSLDFGGTEFTVAGIYYSSKYGYAVKKEAYLVPRLSFILIADTAMDLNKAMVFYSDGKTYVSARAAAEEAGFKTSVPSNIEQSYENVALGESFFSAIALVLSLIEIFILYSLISTFYRQRRGQMCRMGILGARSKLIAAVYCTIVIAAVIVAVAVGSALSVAFNIYYMDLCSQIFNTTFPPNFYMGTPFAVFAALAVAVACLFVVVGRSVSTASLAAEVKNE